MPPKSKTKKLLAMSKQPEISTRPVRVETLSRRPVRVETLTNAFSNLQTHRSELEKFEDMRQRTAARAEAVREARLATEREAQAQAVREARLAAEREAQAQAQAAEAAEDAAREREFRELLYMGPDDNGDARDEVDVLTNDMSRISMNEINMNEIGGGYRKNKSRRHKTRRHKSRRHKTRRHKTRRHKSRR